MAGYGRHGSQWVKNLKIIRELIIETFFAKAYDYVHSTPVPLRKSGRE